MLKMVSHEDFKIFYHINGIWHNGFLDAVLPFMRNPFFWAPLYLFLFLFMTINYRWKGLLWAVFFFLTFSCTDYLCGHILKYAVMRVRPCNDPVVSHYTRLLVPCGGGYSFPSNHAANHFGLGTFMLVTLRRYFGNWMWIAIAWAFIISYAQIYVGVHYPVDVTVGMLIGILFGMATGKIFNRKIGLLPAA